MVGAPRSGTKMLRDLLRLHPCNTGGSYEVERVWCHGNHSRFGMTLSPSDLTPASRNYIRSYFYKASARRHGKRLVDKNVHNSMRIAYIHAIFPNSPIIHIVRDGRDVVCSLREIWQSTVDYSYIIKTRSFPIREIPFFVKRQLKWKLEKVLTGKKHVKWWGPKFDDMEELINSLTLIEICSIQWKRCTEAAYKGLAMLKPECSIQVKYEDVVMKPAETMEMIYDFLKLQITDHLRNRISEYVNAASVGRWQRALSLDDVELIMPNIYRTLLDLGYVKQES